MSNGTFGSNFKSQFGGSLGTGLGLLVVAGIFLGAAYAVDKLTRKKNSKEETKAAPETEADAA